MLANQISGKPIDYAILQMQFSEKRASSRIMNMLATAKDHAIRYKRLDPSKLIVCKSLRFDFPKSWWFTEPFLLKAQAWVGKGPRPPKRVEPRGRGHHGIRIRSNAHMKVVLEHGKTLEEQKAIAFQQKLKRIASPSIIREDQPLRNPARQWTW